MSIKAELINADKLTPREGEIAALMSEGLSNKAISRLLTISAKTVAAHIESIYQKLDLRSQSINTRCAAILTMVARGMIQIDCELFRVKRTRINVTGLHRRIDDV